MTPDPTEVFTDDAFNLIVKYADGELRKINIKSFLVGSNEIKTNLSLFKRVFIEDGAAVTWSNGVSLDPEHIYTHGERVAKVEEVGRFLDKVKAKYSVE
jgi:hypothetical protein